MPSNSQIAKLLVTLTFCVGALLVWQTQSGRTTAWSREPSPYNYLVQDQKRDAVVIREMIASTLALQLTHPELTSDYAYQDLSIGDLVVLFERVWAPDALKVLVSIGFYNIGTGPHETFDCLLLEKGSEILPLLAATKVNECIERFGKQSSGPHRGAVCLDDQEWTDWKRSTIEDIQRNQKCSLREFF